MLNNVLKMAAYQKRLKDMNPMIQLAKKATLFYEKRNRDSETVHIPAMEAQIAEIEAELKLVKKKFRGAKTSKERIEGEKQIEKQKKAKSKLKKEIKAHQDSLQHIVRYSYSWLENISYLHDSFLEELREDLRLDEDFDLAYKES